MGMGGLVEGTTLGSRAGIMKRPMSVWTDGLDRIDFDKHRYR